MKDMLQEFEIDVSMATIHLSVCNNLIFHLTHQLFLKNEPYKTVHTAVSAKQIIVRITFPL